MNYVEPAKEEHQADKCEPPNWRLWCRLCAKDDVQGNISVFLKDERSETFAAGLEMAIAKHFTVKITPTDELSEMLCTECLSLVTALTTFSERVAKVQHMFEELLASSADMATTNTLHAVRLKHGLLDEERLHMMQQLFVPLSEVHYCEAKPTINDLNEKLLDRDLTLESFIGESPSPALRQPMRQRVHIKRESRTDLVHTTEDAQNVFETNMHFEEVQQGEHSHETSGEDPFDGAANADLVAADELEFLDNDSTAKTDIVEAVSDLSRETNTAEKANNETQPHKSLKRHTTRPLNRRRIKKCKRVANDEKPLSEDEEPTNSTSSEEEHLHQDTNPPVDQDQEQLVQLATSHVYCCTECPRKFKRIQHYRQHMKRTHSKVAAALTLECEQCARIFNAQYKLEKHMKSHLPDELKKVLPCPYCNKRYSANSLVQTHIKHIHMNERPFICEECGVAVRTNASLKMHMLIHTDYAPYECEVCKKTFKEQTRLKNHMEIHDPNKHICAECGMQLNSRSTLNRHLLVHSDEMKHKCDYCGRAFKRAKALKNHLILHTGLKPYACDFCDRTFANGSNCRSHKKKAHPDELAALEAAGGGKTFTKNIPKLEALKAVTKAADNLAPVVSKQSGRFAFGKKPKSSAKEQEPIAFAEYSSTTDTNRIEQAAVGTSPLGEASTSESIGGIPTIDNIYSHILKQALKTSEEEAPSSNRLAIEIKRAPSEVAASPACGITEQDGLPSIAPINQLAGNTSLLQMQQHRRQHHQQQLHMQHQQGATSAPQQQQQLFYAPTQRPPHGLIVQPHCDELIAMSSPDTQASTCDASSSTPHVTLVGGCDQSAGNSPQHFYDSLRQGPFL